MDIKEWKELVRIIELLGDKLADTENLAQNICDTIKKKDGIHGYNVDIINILRSLKEASNWYTYFHTYYLGRLNKIQKT